MAPLEILKPRSLTEAVGMLADNGEDARPVAGATAITLLLRQRLITPRYLVSLNDLPGLNRIERQDAALHLGALVTHREVEQSPIVRESIPVLASTFGRVGNVRVRNMATVGGVVAEADYASDPPCVLLALDARIEVWGPGGGRAIAIADFFKGFYETALAAGEIVTGVSVPIPPAGTRAVYQKYVTRSSEDRPCVGVAAIAHFDGHTCTRLSVAVGAATETPQRLPQTEALARGLRLTEDVARAVADGYADTLDTMTDLRGSAWYRTEMIRVWVRRAILETAA